MSRRQLTFVLGLLALAVWVSLVSGWRSSSDRSSTGKSGQPIAVEKASRLASTNAGGHATSYAGRNETELPTRLAEALNSPDPRVRIRALETWAQHPGDKLDPVTYALVDPDESVRTRAQELLEAVLARR
jgi:HEAT repeat protein